MRLWTRFRIWREQRAIYLDNYYAVTAPALGAYFLLRAHKYDPELNLATVKRVQDFSWATFYYMRTNLGPYRKKAERILKGLDMAIENFEWDNAKHTTDYYSDASVFYEMKGRKS